MTDTRFWLLIAATVAMFVVWLAANVFFVAVGDAGAIVPLSSRPNWRARVDAAMLLLPALTGLGAALLTH
ncbi:MAG: hypothetical protein ACYDBZ_06275 [Steroidobacteraceae bacterium]